jgi:hypothetical protein
LVADEQADLQDIHNQVDYKGQNKAIQRFLDNHANERVLVCSHALLSFVMFI